MDDGIGAEADVGVGDASERVDDTTPILSANLQLKGRAVAHSGRVKRTCLKATIVYEIEDRARAKKVGRERMKVMGSACKRGTK